MTGRQREFVLHFFLLSCCAALAVLFWEAVRRYRDEEFVPQVESSDCTDILFSAAERISETAEPGKQALRDARDRQLARHGCRWQLEDLRQRPPAPWSPRTP